MNVKLVTGLAGDRFSFRPGQVIKCSDATGGRLVDAGHAKQAQQGAEIEGELFDETAEEKLSAKGPAKPEKAVAAAPETPESPAGPARHCAGQTKAGNDCLKAPAPGSDFCAAHQPGA